MVARSRGSCSGYNGWNNCNDNRLVSSRQSKISRLFMERMNRGLSSSVGRYSGGGGRNGLLSWNEDHLSYIDTNKRSSNIIGHDDCWRRIGDYIVKVRSENGMRSDHSCLDNIHVKRDMDNDRGYNGESRRRISLSCCGGEGEQRDEGIGGNTRKKGRSSQSDSPGADLEHGTSILTNTHRFNNGDDETSSGSPTLL